MSDPDAAKRTASGGFDNVIAGLGGAWNRGIERHADRFFNANINHGNANAVLPLGIKE